jgi:hypothetical protein
MNMLIGIVRRIVEKVSGNTFAKPGNTEPCGTTTYTFSSRGSNNDRNGKGMRLQPVTVKAK